MNNHDSRQSGAKTMRTITKILLFLIIIVGGVFTILALSDKPHSSQNTNVTSDPPDPCASAELQMLEEEYNQNPDAVSEQISLEKIAANETAMAECARLATAYPPAAKPQDQIGVLLPTLTPLPPPEIVLGIQKAIALPSGDFIPTSTDEYNFWAGKIDGKIVQLYAGFQRDRDGETPAGSTDRLSQGAVYAVDSNWGKIALIASPTRNGTLHFVKECDSLLLLQAADGTLFTFDPAQLVFVSNNTSCSKTK